jgi:RNA polymerase sigma-70 factor (ECF subfamily)
MKHSDAPDADLVSRARGGDELALTELLTRYERYVFSIILRIVEHPDDAKDVMQDVKVKVLMKIDSFTCRSSFISWLASIARNASITFRRRSAPRRMASLATDPVDNRSGDESIAAEKEELRACIIPLMEDILNDRDRDLLRLVYWEGWQLKQIAKEWNEPENTVKSWVRRAREELRTRISDRFGQDAAALLGDGCAEALPFEARWFDADRLVFAENRIEELLHELKSLESAAGVGDLVNAIHEELESLTAYQTWCKRRLLAFVENIAEEHLNEGE